MIHIAICDDDKSFIEDFKRLLIRAGINGQEVMFYEYFSGEQFIKKLEDQSICDLLIMDMKMGRMNGNQAALRFRKKFPGTVLVFCSGVCQPTDEAFKAAPFRYLLKDYSEHKMLRELKEVVNEVQNKQNSPGIVGRYYYNLVRLRPDEILFIENAKHGSDIHVRNHSIANQYDTYIKTDKKIAELYDELKDYGFAYAHNSYIVNLDYIISMKSGGEITLEDGTILSVARSKLKSFREQFYDRIEKRP